MVLVRLLVVVGKPLVAVSESFDSSCVHDKLYEGAFVKCVMLEFVVFVKLKSDRFFDLLPCGSVAFIIGTSVTLTCEFDWFEVDPASVVVLIDSDRLGKETPHEGVTFVVTLSCKSD